MNQVISCPLITKRSIEELARLVDVMEEAKRGCENDVHKLDAHTREDWEKSLGSSEEFPKFSDLTEFPETRAHALVGAR